MPSEARSPRLAVLIDADNTSAKIADGLFEEIAKIGEASVRRIYGDFSSARSKGWADVLSKHAIIPQQQFSYTTGKNASDITLVIDAMDLLHSGPPRRAGRRARPSVAIRSAFWRSMVRESRSVSGASAQRSAFERGGRPVRSRPCRELPYPPPIKLIMYPPAMSALPPKADIRPRDQDVCFGSTVICCVGSGNLLPIRLNCSALTQNMPLLSVAVASRAWRAV